MAEDDGFLSRWSRRKAVVQSGKPAPVEPGITPPLNRVEAAAVAPAHLPDVPLASPPATDAVLASEPATKPEVAPLTLADVAALTRDSDYSAFVARGVAPDVRNAALKQLFTDPHYNIMDGLDTYIDDYGKPDPLPPGMLRRMTQTAFLKLFDDEPEAEAADAAIAQSDAGEVVAPAALPADSDSDAAPAAPFATTAPPPPEPAPDEDPDLRLQPDDAAGRTGSGTGAVEDPRRQR
ncbi:MAG: DUF3306 domain-containing protein [Rubrivivax sp.]